MKNIFKLIGIIAMLAIMGSSFTTCGDAGDSGNSGGTVTNEKAVYTSVDDDGNKYELTITPKSDRAAYEPKEGDTYTLTIFYVDGTTKTSVGTVTQEVKSGSTVTATLSVSDISYTVTLITITDDVRVFTEIKGTIPITSGNDDDPPTIEIELTLTPQVEKENDAVIGVLLNKTALAFDVGGSEALVATVLPTNAANKNVTWSSSDEAVAIVTANGEVIAVGPGEATITVSTEDGGITKSCIVSVREVGSTVAVTGVSLNKRTTSLLISGTETLYETVLPSNATNKAVTWSSSNTNIVTVTDGLITGIAAGTANITVKTEDGGFIATCAVLVNASVVLPQRITINKTILNLGVGDTETLTATVLPTNATDQNVTWEITNPDDKVVATVSESGIVNAVSVGDTQIFAITSNGIKTACAVKVRDVSPIEVILNKTSLALNVGASETLIATVLPANATNKTVKWESSAPSVAIVENGLVTALSAGSATITVETVDGKKTATCAVTVIVPTIAVTFSSVTANGSSSQTSTELTLTFSATITGLSAADIKLSEVSGVTKGTLSGSNPYTLPISGFTAGGTLKVEVEKTGYTISGTQTVEIFVFVPVSGVSLNKHTLELEWGTSETLVPTVLPANASNKAVTWSSSDTAIATVSESGIVTGFDLGKTTITVKTVDGEFTDTCDVTLSYITPAVLAAYLAKKSENTTSTPHNIPLKVSSIDEFEIIKSALFGTPNKYVNLVLSSSTITNIAENAFYLCRNLIGITIPDSVISFTRNDIFYGCTNLTSVNIGNGVASIEDYVFSSCSSLIAINVVSGNNTYSSDNGVLYNKNKTTLVKYPQGKTETSFTIPDSVTSIWFMAFGNCTNLTSVNISDSVISIGEYAFGGCTSLSSITIPNSVINIEKGAFYNCNSLTSITIPNSVTSIGQDAFRVCSSLASIIFTEPSKVTSIGELAFGVCTSLSSITIPNSVISIGSEAFGYCYGLATVTIGNSVTSFGGSTFLRCTSLASVTFATNSKVTSIAQSAFYDCSSLSSITIPTSVTSIGQAAFMGCASLASITIPDSVTSIGEGAFSNCTSLASITIGSNVTNIGNGALGDCTKLISISVDSGNNSYSSENGVLYNKSKTTLIQYPAGKSGAFTIPNSVTSISSSAFINCTSLASVTIPDSVTSISSRAFTNCTSLASIILPDSVTAISQLTFDGCTSLTNVTIPNSVTFIGDWAFRDCSSLTSIIIPDLVTSIGNNTFYRCSSLTSVTLPGNITSINTTAFDGDLRAKYFASNGGQGTYTTTAPVGENAVWTKQ